MRAEQILLLANRLSYRATELGDAPGGWRHLRLGYPSR